MSTADHRLDGVDPGSAPGAIVAVRLQGNDFAAIRSDRGWVLVPDRCPHAACALSQDGEVFDGSVLSCVCHGSEFDLATGDVLLGPALDPLEVVRLVERDGALYRPAGPDPEPGPAADPGASGSEPVR